MRKLASVFLVFLMIFSLAACGNESKPQENPSQTNNETVQSQSSKSTEPQDSESDAIASSDEEESKTLVVYFSWSTSGNTEKMATLIAEKTNADLHEIEPKVAYPTDYDECGDVAKVERDEDQRPEIANLPADLDEYETIFIGYPIWWHTAPMIIGTFLESYDLSGKEVYPFTQSASMDTEQFENSMEFVKEAAEGANVHDGLFVSASDTDAILAYLNENGFTE